MDETYKELYEIVGLLYKGEPLLFMDRLEQAIDENHMHIVREIVLGLKNKHEDYTAKVYPLEGIKISTDISCKRLQMWHKKGILCSQLLSLAKRDR